MLLGRRSLRKKEGKGASRTVSLVMPFETVKLTKEGIMAQTGEGEGSCLAEGKNVCPAVATKLSDYRKNRH
jgi:hypothetical protein